MRYKFLILLLLVISFEASAAPDAADDVLGFWMIESREAVIEIRRTGDDFTGFIAWLLNSKYGAEDGPALAGKPLLDHQNPDPALRRRPLIGLPMLTELRYDGQGGWRDGHVYNLETGGTYGVQLSLADREHLKLRGFLGIALFGSTSVWTRVAAPPQP